jgi:hypothetical protein
MPLKGQIAKYSTEVLNLIQRGERRDSQAGARLEELVIFAANLLYTLISVVSQANSRRMTHGSGLLLPRNAVLAAVCGFRGLECGDKVIHCLGDADANGLLEIIANAVRLGGVLLVLRLLDLLEAPQTPKRQPKENAGKKKRKKATLYGGWVGLRSIGRGEAAQESSVR